MIKIESLNELCCMKCGYKWTPRGNIVSICPNCNSYKFDQPLTAKEQKRIDSKSRRDTSVFREIV